MPDRKRYAKQKFNRDFANAEAGSVLRFPDGSEIEVFQTVTQETPEQKAARLENEAREREQARAWNARYNRTEARKISKKTYDKTPAGKVIRDRHEKARQERVQERRLVAPFWGIDTEGVSMHEAAWIETENYTPTPALEPRRSAPGSFDG